MTISAKPHVQPAADDAARIAAQAQPVLPPARLSRQDKQVAFNTRLRESTLAEIERLAREQGSSMKLVICRALQAAGVKVAAADLEDRTPRRQRAA
jgi:hypothetical protein